MTLDSESVSPRDFYRQMIACITPRPIAWVSSLSPRGIPNLAPFSFFNGLGANPPSIMFSPLNRRDGSRKDTVLNIEQTREFVVSVVPARLGTQMNATSADVPYEISEFAHVGLTPLASVRVKPPRVKESPIHMECELHTIVPVGEGPLAANVIIGRILLLHINDAVLDATGQVDPDKLDTIGRMGASLYSYTRDRFEMGRP